MKRLVAALGLWFAVSLAAAAEQWSFESRISVSGEPSARVYRHLDGAGRKHIAVSGASVAATWEDNRDGSPRVYATSKPLAASRFPAPIRGR